MKILEYIELIQEEGLNKELFVLSVLIPAKRRIKMLPAFVLIRIKAHGFASTVVGQEDSI